MVPVIVLALAVIILVGLVVLLCVRVAHLAKERDYWASAFLFDTLNPPNVRIDAAKDLMRLTDPNQERGDA